jgi:hypothetical protein
MSEIPMPTSVMPNPSVSRANTQVQQSAETIVLLSLKHDASVRVKIGSGELLQIPIPIPFIVVVGALDINLIKLG